MTTTLPLPRRNIVALSNASIPRSASPSFSSQHSQVSADFHHLSLDTSGSTLSNSGSAHDIADTPSTQPISTSASSYATDEQVRSASPSHSHSHSHCSVNSSIPPPPPDSPPPSPPHSPPSPTSTCRKSLMQVCNHADNPIPHDQPCCVADKQVEVVIMIDNVKGAAESSADSQQEEPIVMGDSSTVPTAPTLPDNYQYAPASRTHSGPVFGGTRSFAATPTWRHMMIAHQAAEAARDRADGQYAHTGGRGRRKYSSFFTTLPPNYNVGVDKPIVYNELGFPISLIPQPPTVRRMSRSRSFASVNRVDELVDVDLGSGVPDEMKDVELNSSSSSGQTKVMLPPLQNNRLPCPICLEVPELTTPVSVLYTCYHLFCRDCLHAYCRHEIENGNLNIRCPSLGSDGTQACGKAIPNPVLKTIAGEELFAKYERFRLLRHSENYRSCHRCSHVQKGSSSHPQMVCEQCGFTYCFHHDAAHPDGDCKQYERQLRQQHHQAIKTSTSLVDRTTIKCPWPLCRAPITKESGCNHMTCSRCDTEFCYLCGGMYMGGLHFAAWNYLGCPDMKSSPGLPGSRKSIMRTLLRVVFGIPLAIVFMALYIALILALFAVWLAYFAVTALPIFLPIYLYARFCLSREWVIHHQQWSMHSQRVLDKMHKWLWWGPKACWAMIGWLFD